MKRAASLLILFTLACTSWAAGTGSGYTTGPDSSYSINLIFSNDASSTSDLLSIMLDGSTATTFPILWDGAGTASGPAGADVSFSGVDTQWLTISFLDNLDGFNPGESLTLSGVDPDGDPGPASVTIGELLGVQALFSFEDGSTWAGVYVDDPAEGAGLVLAERSVTGPTVPAPGAALLASLGAGLVGWLRRRQTV